MAIIPGRSRCCTRLLYALKPDGLFGGLRLRTRHYSVSGHDEEDSGPRPPHGAYAATMSNGLCDHTRAMPRPWQRSYAPASVSRSTPSYPG